MELTSIFLFSVRAATNLFPKVINEIILDSLEFREYKLITQSERENNIQNRIWSILLTLSTSPASLPLKAKIGRFLAHCNKCRPASWGLMRDQAMIWYSSLFGWGEGGIRISGGFYVFFHYWGVLGKIWAIWPCGRTAQWLYTLHTASWLF